MKHWNKTYKWCTKCNNGKGAWKFHWADEHDAWKQRQKDRNADRPTGAAAAVATTEANDDEDFIAFGGGLIRSEE